MDLKKIRDLDIAKNKVDFVNENNEQLDYLRWIDYIENHSEYFIWIENTVEGKETLANIDKVPESFRDRILDGHDKKACNAEFDPVKGYYNIRVAFYLEYNRIRIDFERTPNALDLKRFVDMAKYLDAYLLNNGNEIMDDTVLENL